MPQFLDQNPRSEHGGAVEPAVNLVARLISALDDWREREQLRRELAALAANGELDGVLEEIGVSRGQLPLLLARRLSAAPRLDPMIQRLGLDRAALRATGELREAEWRCLQCQTWRQCESWLAADQLGDGFASFCPNTPTFELVRAWRSTDKDDMQTLDDDGSAHAEEGVLSELDAIRGQIL